MPNKVFFLLVYVTFDVLRYVEADAACRLSHNIYWSKKCTTNLDM